MPYFALGLIDLNMLKEYGGKHYQPMLGKLTSVLKGCTHWQYGIGNHASTKRRILRHVNIHALSDNGQEIVISRNLHHGSLQCILGKNVTDKCDIMHIGRIALKFEVNGEHEFSELTNANMLSYVNQDKLKFKVPPNGVLSALVAKAVNDKKWTKVMKIIDKVDKYVWGHA